MTKKKPTRGGARKGAGRPPKRPEERVRSATVTAQVPLDLHERLLRRVLETQESVSAIVRAALERELAP